MPSGQGGVFAAIQRRRATRQAGEHVTASSRAASNQEWHCRQRRRMRIVSVTYKAMCDIAWPVWPAAVVWPEQPRPGASAGLVSALLLLPQTIGPSASGSHRSGAPDWAEVEPL